MNDEFRRVVDAIPGLVWTAQPDGEVDFVNQRWSDYTGLSLDEAFGWKWQTAIYPEDLPGLLATWRSLLAAGKPGEMEARLRRLDGSYRWFLVRVVPVFDDAGHPVKWYGQATDIDDHKRAEALLAGEKHLLEMVAARRALPVVLDALCRLVEDMAGGWHCSILLTDSSGTNFMVGAAPSLPSDYNQWVQGKAINAEAAPCGMAASLKRQ